MISRFINSVCSLPALGLVCVLALGLAAANVFTGVEPAPLKSEEGARIESTSDSKSERKSESKRAALRTENVDENGDVEKVIETNASSGEENSTPTFSPARTSNSSGNAPVDKGSDNQFDAGPFGVDSLSFAEEVIGVGGIRDTVNAIGAAANLYQDSLSGAGPRNAARVTELQAAVQDTRYCIVLDVIPANGLLTLRVSSGILPKGLLVLAAARQLCGTPKASGIFRFTIEAAYGSNDVRSFSFRLVVKESEGKEDQQSAALTVSTLQLAVGAVGTPYASQLSAVGGTPPYSWTVSNLPEGLEFDSESGVLAGTPNTEGIFGLQFTVSDSKNARNNATLELTVRNSPVFITTSALEDGVIDTFYQTQFTAQGGIPPYTWRILSGTLPEGLSIDPGDGVIRGEPVTTGISRLRIQVLDNDKKTDAADFTLTIRTSDLRINTRALPEGFVDKSYSASFSAEGGKPPYTWSTQQGSFPSGLMLNGAGQVQGMPLVKQESAVVVRVTDEAAQVAEQALLVRVVEASTPTPTPSPTPEPTAEATPSPAPTLPGVGPEESPTPEPSPSLPSVTGFKATTSDSKIALLWNAPNDPRLIDVIIVRNDLRFPTDSSDGIIVAQGLNNNTALDENLLNGRTYFYAAFAAFPNAEFSNAESARLSATPQDVSIFGKPDAFVDEVIDFAPLDPSGCFNCSRVNSIVLGGPKGAGDFNGSADVVSLNAKANSDNEQTPPYGGSITLKFSDNVVVDGPGIDFIVFENAFRLQGTDLYWVEPATVEVSADGVHFYRFPFDFVPHFDSGGNLNLQNPFSYASGFSGVKPVYSNNNVPDPSNPPLAGGDQFDLSQLPGKPVKWIQYVRITSTGDAWIRDIDGDFVRHMNGTPTFATSGTGNSGFDLDAISAVHY